ncbi:hypothetical protein ACP70R_045860 [Stipagrostis hirtigluma subsp. patula]
MAWSSGSSRSHGSMGVAAAVGRRTGLPLIQCPDCGVQTVIELEAKEGDNKGRVFFKCPLYERDEPCPPCKFFRWQDKYEELLRKRNKSTNEPWNSCQAVADVAIRKQHMQDLEQLMASSICMKEELAAVKKELLEMKAVQNGVRANLYELGGWGKCVVILGLINLVIAVLCIIVQLVK